MQTMPSLRGVNQPVIPSLARDLGGGAAPSHPPGSLATLGMTTPPPPHFEAYAYSKPARTYTGDFYLTHQDSDRLWFVLGDVAGKGINAAVIMAMIQEELEHRIASCATTKCDPSVTLSRLHE